MSGVPDFHLQVVSRAIGFGTARIAEHRPCDRTPGCGHSYRSDLCPGGTIMADVQSGLAHKGLELTQVQFHMQPQQDLLYRTIDVDERCGILIGDSLKDELRRPVIESRGEFDHTVQFSWSLGVAGSGYEQGEDPVCSA